MPSGHGVTPHIDKTSVSMGAASAGTLIGFSTTILTLLLTSSSVVSNLTAFYWTLVFLVLAIIFFATATEFYILAAWRAQTPDEYTQWAFRGSIPYSLGMGWLVLSVGMMFLALTKFPLLPYVPQVGFLVSWITVFATRPRGEPFQKARWILRGLMLAQVVAGILAVYCLSRG